MSKYFAHCTTAFFFVRKKPGYKGMAWAGLSDRDKKNSKGVQNIKFTFNDVVIHDNWDPSLIPQFGLNASQKTYPLFLPDIALIKLPRNFKVNQYVQWACLPRSYLRIFYLLVTSSRI